MSSTSFEVTSDLARTTAMPAGRRWGAYLAEAKYECVRTLRMPGFTIPFLLLPVSLYVFFAVILFGAALRGQPNAGMALFTGFAAFGVMGPGMFGFGVFVAMEREQGLLTLKRALPMPPAAYLLAKMFMAMLFAAIVMATMIVAALSLAHLKLTARQLLSVAGINVLGALPFCALGLFIGTRATGKSAPAFVNLAYFPIMYLGGLWFPLPGAVAWVMRCSPAFYLDQLALRMTGLPTHVPAVLDVAVLVGVTLLLTAFSVRRLARVG